MSHHCVVDPLAVTHQIQACKGREEQCIPCFVHKDTGMIGMVGREEREHLFCNQSAIEKTFSEICNIYIRGYLSDCGC